MVGKQIKMKTRIKGPKPLKADLHLHTAEDPSDKVSYTAKELISKAAFRWSAVQIPISCLNSEPPTL